jgi:hypothetical protein
MLSEVIAGLSLIASAFAAFAIKMYVAKKVSSISASLNQNNHLTSAKAIAGGAEWT